MYREKAERLTAVWQDAGFVASFDIFCVYLKVILRLWLCG